MTITITQLEKKWLKYTNSDNVDLSIFPLTQPFQNQNCKNNKKLYGEVFTPLWLVDKMILQALENKKTWKIKTLDLCAGYGQFSIRLCRALYNNFSDFDLEIFLSNYLYFNEINPESIKILYKVFGKKINLYACDARLIDSKA